MIILWNTILERFDATQKKPQAVNICLADVVNLYKSLHDFIASLRNESTFDFYKERACNISVGPNIFNAGKRKRKTKKNFNESTEEDNTDTISVRTKFKVRCTLSSWTICARQ